jgi:hypothetical protein
LTPKQLYQKEYRRKNSERLREYNKQYQRDYYKERPEQYLYWQLKTRAKTAGVPFNLTLDDIIIPTHCPILGIPIFRNKGSHGPTGNSPSVDRLVPALGYVKGNVWVISQRANVMKNDASFEELERFADWVKNSLPSLKTSTVSLVPDTSVTQTT